MINIELSLTPTTNNKQQPRKYFITLKDDLSFCLPNVGDFFSYEKALYYTHDIQNYNRVIDNFQDIDCARITSKHIHITRSNDILIQYTVTGEFDV